MRETVFLRSLLLRALPLRDFSRTFSMLDFSGSKQELTLNGFAGRELGRRTL